MPTKLSSSGSFVAALQDEQAALLFCPFSRAGLSLFQSSRGLSPGALHRSLWNIFQLGGLLFFSQGTIQQLNVLSWEMTGYQANKKNRDFFFFNALVPKLLWPDLIASTKYKLFLTETWVLSKASSTTTPLLGFSSCFSLCLLADQRVKAGGPESIGQLLFWGLQSSCPQVAQVLPNLLQPVPYFRNNKKHLCCCQQRVLCLCQCSICHVIWHCTDITAALQVDINVFPAGGGLVWAGAKGSPILRGCTYLHVKTRSRYHLCVHKQVKMFLAGECFLFPWNPP